MRTGDSPNRIGERCIVILAVVLFPARVGSLDAVFVRQSPVLLKPAWKLRTISIFIEILPLRRLLMG